MGTKPEVNKEEVEVSEISKAKEKEGDLYSHSAKETVEMGYGEARKELSKELHKKIEIKQRADGYIDALLERAQKKDDDSFLRIVTLSGAGEKVGRNEHYSQAICILGDEGFLKEMTFKIIMCTSPEVAVQTAKEVVSGLENLKKLEKHGMNTSEKQVKVAAAGLHATETSLKLWEARKVELQKAARKSEHPGLYNNFALRHAARAKTLDKLNQIEAMAHLNRPTSMKVEVSKGVKK